MAQRIRHLLLILLLFSLLTGAGAAETVFVDNFADLKNNLSAGGEKTVILTADIIADSSITVKGKITLTTEEGISRQISFENARTSDDGYLTVEEGTIFTIAGNKSGKITLSGKNL